VEHRGVAHQARRRRPGQRPGRRPVPHGPARNIDYQRTTRTDRDVAKAIRDREGVVVIHGVDYNRNGSFDFDSAGASELDPTLAGWGPVLRFAV
jgi:hypothetical protein